MLQVSHLSKRFGAHSVLEDVSFVVNPGECAGLVGPNGSGKTTLLRCITGDERPDSGVVSIDPGARIGWLQQVPEAGPDETVASFAGGEVSAAERELQAASESLARGGPVAAERYAAAADRFDLAGGYEQVARAREMLQRFGFADDAASTPVAVLSGGQKTRLMLARTLLDRPDILLLDEPTNHLDVEALDWLAQFVRAFAGAVLVVSHDRAFLDDVADAILYLDPTSRSITRYPGNYADFVEARAAERAQQTQDWKEQQGYVARVRSDIARLKGEALAIEKSTTPRQPGLRVYARRKAAIAKSREKKLDRYLESEDRVEKPRSAWGLKVDFDGGPSAGREAYRLRDVSFAYPGGDPVLRDVSLDIRHGDRIAVTGANGSGKTTLLRLLSGEATAQSGEAWRSPNVRLAVLSQEQENLDPSRTVLETVRPLRAWDETGARSFLHLFLFAGDAVNQRVGDCSPGERARLQLAVAVAAGANVLLLDEPMNHLDIEGREHFEEALAAFPGTVVAVSHDRRFVERFARRVFHVKDAGVAVTG
jgi:ATP-binding cassette subfamily F protein 3